MNAKTRYGYQPDLTNESAIVEVKASLKAARGLRDALVSLAMFLAEETALRGYLLLLNPGLSRPFIEAELRRYKGTLRPDLAHRLHLVIVKEGEVVAVIDDIRDEDSALLHQGLNLEEAPRNVLTNASKQDEVFLVMLHQWVTGQGPLTSKWIEEHVGCNYRTVTNAIDRLGHAVRRHSDRSVSLKYFPEQDWGRVLATAQKIRSTQVYTDVSDQPRSPESLLTRLHKLQRHDVAVGGVLGAKRYYEELDIVGTPRLDLCVHCPHSRVDTTFVHKLDPALERTRDTHRPGRLALHFIRRKSPFFDQELDGSQWADPVECLLELYTAHLDLQAQSFQAFLAMRGRALSGES